MSKFFTEIKGIIKDPKCSVPVLLTAVLAYAYQLTRFNIGIDDVVRSRYMQGGLFAQGRFSGPVLSYSFGFVKPFPFFEPFVAVLFLLAAAFSMAVLFSRASGGRLPRHVLTFFACLFVSYPLISEIFVYKGSELYTGVGYFLCAVSMLVMDGIFHAEQRPKTSGIVARVAVATAIQFFLVSLYESFIPVTFVLAGLYVFTAVFFREKTASGSGNTDNAPEKDANAPEKDANAPGRLRDVFLLLLPAVIGVVLEYLFGLLINALIDFGVDNVAANTIYIPEKLTLSFIVNTLYSIFRRFFLAGLWYLPIGLFAAAFIVSLPVFIAVSAKRKNIAVIFSALAVYAGLFGIALLVAGEAKYRTCHSFAPFVAFMIAFVFYLLTGKFEKKPARIVAGSLAGIIVVCQCVSMNFAFVSNEKRWNEEKSVLLSCAEKLTDGSYNVSSKPVIFIGEYTLSDEVMSTKYVRSDDPLYKSVKSIANAAGFNLATTDLDDTYVIAACQSGFGSVITWGVYDKVPCNDGLLLVFRELGYDFIQGTTERFEELDAAREDFPAFNETGEITELEDVIVVRFR